MEEPFCELGCGCWNGFYITLNSRQRKTKKCTMAMATGWNGGRGRTSPSSVDIFEKQLPVDIKK